MWILGFHVAIAPAMVRRVCIPVGCVGFDGMRFHIWPVAPYKLGLYRSMGRVWFWIRCQLSPIGYTVTFRLQGIEQRTSGRSRSRGIPWLRLCWLHVYGSERVPPRTPFRVAR